MVNVRTALNTLWRGRWIIASAAIALALVAGAFISTLEPKYQASATVMFGIQRANITDLQKLLSTPEFDDSQLENEVQTLRSSNLLRRVIKELDLQNDPLFNPALQGEEETEGGETRGFLSGVKDLFAGLKGAPDEEITPEEIERRKLLVAVKQIRDNLVLEPVIDSTVIQISYSAYAPDVSADIVNAIAEQYIVDQLQVKLETASAATNWLTTRVEELRQRVLSSEEAVENTRAELSYDAGQGLEITQQQLAALNAVLSTARGRAANAEAHYARLSDAMESGMDLSTESPLIQEYRDQEGDLLSRRNTLSTNHPAIPQIDAQLKTVRERIQDEVRRVASSAKVELETAQTQIQELEEAVRGLESKMLTQSRDEIRIRQLEREAQANRNLYENLLVRLNETSEQEDLQDADARILSPADAPIEPESRNAVMIVIMAGLLGGFMGTGFVFVRDNLNNTFRSPRQIEEMTGLSVLATLPALRAKARNRDIVRHLLRSPRSSLSEAIRHLRTSILPPNAKDPPKVVMFTSSVPAEGKSTTSMLTAITSCQMGKSTIIVDCDLRLSSIEQFLDTKTDKPGILSVLDGSATLEDALHRDAATGLHALMVRRTERSVKSDTNAADILSSRNFAELVRHLSKIYEVVILDTPPVLVVTDARIVSRLAESVIYVIRWSKTPRDAVIDGLKELHSVRAPIAGTVLSMVDEGKASRQVIEGYTSYHRGKYGAYYKN